MIAKTLIYTCGQRCSHVVKNGHDAGAEQVMAVRKDALFFGRFLKARL